MEEFAALMLDSTPEHLAALRAKRDSILATKESKQRETTEYQAP